MSQETPHTDHTDHTAQKAQADELTSALKQHFGFEGFHRGQREVISSVLSGRPTLAVMPTGAGKSLCYQLPALMSPGLTLVLSPLISLMKDQVDALRARGVCAHFLNHMVKGDEYHEVMNDLESGRCKLLYIAPERFRNAQFMRQLSGVKLSMIAIDEAHCISQWGHDFRPEYAKLGEHLSHLTYDRLLACTATATPLVREDILKALHLSPAQVSVHVAGFLRKNLYLEAHLCASRKDRQALVKRCLLDLEGAVVIYANTQRMVEEYAEVCAGAIGPEQVCAYHGGMSERVRTEAQERFMSGEARVVVATNAFGMGVDRGDVRAVIHVEIPRTIEAYYQEVGRAGRDGLPAQCLLLYGEGDRRVHEFLINQSHPNPVAFEHVFEALQSGPKTPSALQDLLDKRSDQKLDKADVVLRYLSKERLVEYDHQEDSVSLSPQAEALSSLAESSLGLPQIQAHRDHQLKMHDDMFRLAQSGRCRHAELLAYFGEDRLERCPEEASCDRCAESPFELKPAGLAEGELSDAERNLTLKALSGVSRANGYYGSQKVVAMLVGEDRHGAKGTFLAKLSTWGVLSSLTFEACRELINTLKAQGLCEMATKPMRDGTMSTYKTLQLTPLGFQVVTGKTPIRYRLKQAWVDSERRSARLSPSLSPSPSSSSSSSQKSTISKRGSWREAAKSSRSSTQGSRSSVSSKKAPQQETVHVESDLSAALKQYRTLKARELQLPAYTVLSNKTLEKIAEARPLNREDLLAVPGVGPSTWAKFGLEIIKIIQEHA